MSLFVTAQEESQLDGGRQGKPISRSFSPCGWGHSNLIDLWLDFVTSSAVLHKSTSGIPFSHLENGG